jgi:hypothetical protein
MAIPLGTGYEQDFSVVPAVGAVASAQPQLPSSELSLRLEYLWGSDSGGQGGRFLDEHLSNLGDAYIEKGYVRWNPPPDLEPSFVDYLTRSLEALNSHLQAGTLTVDASGNIRPPRNLRSGTALLR